LQVLERIRQDIVEHVLDAPSSEELSFLAMDKLRRRDVFYVQFATGVFHLRHLETGRHLLALQWTQQDSKRKAWTAEKCSLDKYGRTPPF